MIAWHGFVLLVLAAWLPACSCFTGQVFAPAGFLRPNLATSTRRPRTQKDENFKLCKIGPNVEGSWQSSTMSLASPASHALPGNIGYSWRLNVRPHHRHRSQLHAVSTPSAAELPSSERGLLELNRLLDLHEAELDVREAAGMDGDCVAQLRCIVFGQGKDMYRSQRQKMRTSPHYLLAGMYKTTLMVAVVRALTPRAQQVCKDVVLADMQELLDQAWISTWEHAQLVEQFEFEWQQRSELVVGSVDCSVHEMLDSSLTLRRWVYVSSMAVRSFVRKRGIGERLLVLAVAHARKIFGVKQMFLHVEVSERQSCHS
jgi:ribosomal protein S18 acetylase RimI-like enzyme